MVLQRGFGGHLILTCNFAILTVLGDSAVSFLCLIFLRWVLMGRIIANTLLCFTPLLGLEALLQKANSSAGENVLVPFSRQALQGVLQSAGPATGGVSPELVALISQTVQAAIAAERASSCATPIVVPLPSSSTVIPMTSMLPCLVGVPASLPLLASSAESLLASGTGFNVQAVQGRPNYSLVVPSFVSTFVPPSMSSFVPSANATMPERGNLQYHLSVSWHRC